MRKEDYGFQCGLWACPSFVDSISEDPDEIMALSRRYFLHLRSHLEQVELFEFYCGEIAFDLEKASKSGLNSDEYDPFATDTFHPILDLEWNR